MKEHFQGPAHLGVYAKDMEASVAFYEKLGGTVLKRDVIHKPEGDKLFALVEFAGYVLELIQDPNPMPLTEGVIPHIAVYVDSIEETAAAIRAAGIDTFMTPEKKVLPNLFGGVENWFFTDPSGVQIELMRNL